jgi:hypothetical protein
MKRALAVIIAAILTLSGMQPGSAQERIQDALHIQAEATELGDISITWNARPFQSLQNVDFRIGYSYDLADEPRTLRPRRFDPNSAVAIFSKMSLESTFRFQVVVRADSLSPTKIFFNVSTPKPVREFAGSAGITAQLAYVDARWQTRENKTYAYVPKHDCANFVSQTLIARGLPPTSRWHQRNKKATLPFVRATYLRAYLLTIPGFHELSHDQRDQVKLGDIAMFDWDNSGDIDHVGIVNLIQHLPDGSTRIYTAQHTLHRYYRSVDWAITVRHPNGHVSYMSVPESLTPTN